MLTIYGFEIVVGEAMAIIPNNYEDTFFFRLKLHLDMVGLAMLAYIRERFLYDTKNLHLHIWRKCCAVPRRANGQVGLNIIVAGKTLQILLHRCEKGSMRSEEHTSEL